MKAAINALTPEYPHSRAVSVTDEVMAIGFPVYPGALGENLTTRGLDRRALRIGQRFRCGTATIRLTELRLPCGTLNVYGRLAPGVRELVLTEAPEAEEILYSVHAQVIVFKLRDPKRGAFCNVAAYSRHVDLVFYYGAQSPDPHGVLKGSGKQMRHIRFDSPDDFGRQIFARLYTCRHRAG